MAQTEKYLTLTEENFRKEVLESPQPVLVDFWAGWCAPCRAIEPAIKELAELFDGTARIGKVDVDDQQALAQSYDIRSIPTLLYFVNGEIVERTVGAVAKEMLSSKLNSLVEAA